MKKRITFILTAIAVMCVSSALASDYSRQSDVRSGSMMPYDFSKTETTVAWQDSLRPVYLSYTARHGARYLSSPKKSRRFQMLCIRLKVKAC